MIDFNSPDALLARTREFQDPAVAHGYPNRPAYPRSLFEKLATLVAPENRTVLDAGCGTGNVARPFAPYVDHIDAVDASAAMIEVGKTLPGGDNPKISWFAGRVEDLTLTGPYGLVTCGLSMHFFDLTVVIPLFHRLLVSGGIVAMLSVSPEPTAWDRDLEAMRGAVTVPKVREDRAVVETLIDRSLLTNTGDYESPPEPWNPTVDTFIANLRSRSTWAMLLSGNDKADAMTRNVRNLLERNAVNGHLPMTIKGRIWWGTPTPK